MARRIQRDDVTRNYHRGATTSEEANPRESKKLHDRFKILATLGDHAGFGLTCEELEDELDMAHQSCSARLTELKRDGFISTLGKRQNRSGRHAWVYRIRNK